MNDYDVIYEKTETGFSAYTPALPGLGVAGETLEETQQLMDEAIQIHLSMIVEGASPTPTIGAVLTCVSTSVQVVVGAQGSTVLAPQWQPTTDATMVRQFQTA